MGSIEKRGKNSWRISTQIKTPSGWKWVHMTLRMDPDWSEAIQRREAKKELKFLEARLASSEKQFTLGEWAEEWIANHVAPDDSPITVDGYRHLLNSRILPMLSDYPLQDLTPAVLTDWLIAVRNSPRRSTRLPEEKLKHKRPPSQTLAPASVTQRPLSVSTVNHYYTLMVTMLGTAVRLGYLEYNPMDRVKRPKEKKKKQKQQPFQKLSEERVVELIQSLDAPDVKPALRLAVLLALTCSLRLGEAAELKYEDVDWDHGTIDVSRALKYSGSTGSFVDEPKTDASIRQITLPPTMTLILRDAFWDDIVQKTDFPDTWQGQGHIVHGKNGRQLHKDTPSKWFRTFADACGLQHVRFHDLRHAHASLLVAHNLDIAAIAYRMGHSDPSITLKTYTHPLDNREKEAAATLENLFAHPEK